MLPELSRPTDFDRRARGKLRLTYFLAALFYVVAYLLCRFAYGPVVGFVVSAPVLGVYAALLFRYRSESFFGWFRWLALRKREGHHYAFQDFPVRMRWREGQCWVHATDALQATRERVEPDSVARLAARVGPAGMFLDEHRQAWLSEAAVVEWLSPRVGRGDALANKFERWLTREVFPPMHRKAELGSFPDPV